MPPSRRQPPRSTPPVRKPRVAGLRKPETSAVEPEAPSTPEEPPRKPRPRPASRPVPRPGRFPESEGFRASTDVVEGSAEDTTVFEPVEVDALSGEAPAKPAPRRKVRDSGTAKPTDLDEASEVPEPVKAAVSPVKRTFRLAAALVVVGLLLFGASAFFLIKKIEVSDATSNTALLDVAATAQVKDQVSKATEALFSYDYNNIKKTEDAANDLLVNDDVKAKYSSLMGEVKRLAPAQKMVVTCKVTRAAVIRLNGDLADVMVFVDQTSTRADTKKTTAGSAQLHLNAQLQGDKWKITDMNTYPAGNPAAPTAPASSAPASPAPSK